MTKFKVGDQVMITSCSDWDRDGICRHNSACRKGARFTIDEIERSMFESAIWYKPPALSRLSSFYTEDELELITKGEEVKPYQRKTYKQLKDSVTVKKGALWQEACDDGDQEYVLLDSAFNRDPRQTQRIYDRSLVENDPKNFVEVFKVEPEYQTREELDLFEEFKKSRAKVRVARPAAKRVVRKAKKAA